MADLGGPTSIYSKKKTWKRRDPGMPVTRQKRWAEENREKLQAQGLVRQALLKGTLKRGKCEVCGSLRVDGHHPSYAEPLRVIWLCRRHHMLWHSAEKKVADGSIAIDIAALLASSANPHRRGKAA